MRLTRFRPNGSLLAAPVFALAMLGAPTDAEACGGFFCSRSPIDQTAEHIIFTVNDDHTVTAYVQIQYAGDKDDFAWIIPAPGIPKLSADLPDAAMRALDVATEPQYYKQSCFLTPTAGGRAVDAGAASPDGGVKVLARQAVGPFDTVTLEGTSADVLVKWLQDNGYRITDKMTPLIQPYVEGGMHFVAMKLQADKTVTDIQPLVMQYDSDKPMIPVRLTSVAAQPEMGIVAFILASRRWAPENYIDLKIPDSLVDATYGSSNYLKVVSVESDKVGGQAFVTEYAKPTTMLAGQLENMSVNPSVPDAQKARDKLLALLQAYPYITRLYARMSAEEMTEDPIFMPSSDKSDVNNVHDLTDPNFNFSQCNSGPVAQDPCAMTYCGRRGVCTPVDVPLQGNPGVTTKSVACVCANDATARITTTGPYGQPLPYCEPTRLDLDAASDAGAPLLAAACEGIDCGPHGSCVPMNGNPTCQCEGGYGASVSTTYDSVTNKPIGHLGCVAVSGTVPPLPVLPPVGQTKIPASGGASAGGAGGKAQTGTGGAPSSDTGGTPATGDSGGAKNAATSSSSDSGCALSSKERPASPTTFFGATALVALGFLLRRRGARPSG